MYKLYSMQRSGNSYKVRLALALLNMPYRSIEIDILRGESRTPDFLSKNPSGQVPLLEVDEGRYLAESNAILWYVAGGTPLAHAPGRASKPSHEAPAMRCSSNSTRWSRNIGAAYLLAPRWSRAAAICKPTRWKTGWSAAMRRFR